MHYSIPSAAILSLATFGFAQNMVTSAAPPANSIAVSGCGESMDITIAVCLDTTHQQLSTCAATDYSCLCARQTSLLMCYNSCLQDPRVPGAQHSKDSYCSAASRYSAGASQTTSTSTKQSHSKHTSTSESELTSESASTTSYTTTTAPRDTNQADVLAPGLGGMLRLGAGVVAAGYVGRM